MTAAPCQAQGEPAPEFLKRLRAAKYFDTAIEYLDRLDQYPGVDPGLISSVSFEKGQTYIDAAVAARNPDKRDEYFELAEQDLRSFLAEGTHPRQSEARLLLGKLQVIRATQLMAGKPTDEKRAKARSSYLAAAKTFDEIVDALREKLKDLKGANIDAQANPEQAAMRDQYRGDFLEAMKNGAEARQFAAETYQDPAKDGKELLEAALATFTDLSEKYDTYVRGVVAMVNRGQIQEQLGMKDQALDSFDRMLDAPDSDPSLRDARFQAMSGLIRYWMKETPPKFQTAIDRAQPMIDGERPNERFLQSLLELKVHLAKAYLAKSGDTENQKPADIKRAESAGRQLLLKVSKSPESEFSVAAGELLTGLGIEVAAEAPQLPTAEDPTSLEDAYEKAREMLEATENLKQSLAVLEAQAKESPEIATQKAAIAKQLLETRSIGTQILRRGLSMANSKTDVTMLNQTRQFLAFMLYQGEQYRDSAVVGSFLARAAPSTETGLQGGLLALNSFQLLLSKDIENEGLVSQLERLGNYLTETWPDDPKAANAKGVMIKLALRSERWDEARAILDKMPKGNERARNQRAMGKLLWNSAIESRAAGENEEADRKLKEAERELTEGLDGIEGKLVEPEAMKSALILAQLHLKAGDAKKALEILDHKTYGPVPLSEKQGPPDQAFSSSLYSTELQVLVQRMTAEGTDATALLKRATKVMEELRQSIKGPDAQKRLTGIYVGMANEIREQLDTADPAQKTKLIEAFRVLLDRISQTINDPATLQWVGKTLMDLSEASMQPGQIKAEGEAAKLLQTAISTLERLAGQSKEPSLVVQFQLGRGQRLLGNYKDSLDIFTKLLAKKPTMLDAQVEAAQAYESWAGVVPAKFAGAAYRSALNGGRPDAKKQNVIWGWGKISLMANPSRNPKYRDTFFDARYHVALCRFLQGKATKNKQAVEKAITDITTIHTLYPDMGGRERHAKFNALLKAIQKEAGKQPTGLPAFQAKKAG
ncbi:MAG: hypothetical protein AB8B91_10855 [Rubripirellula sp.]